MTTLRYVLPREVSLVTALRGRAKGINRGHVRALARVLRNTGKLDPILLWNERGPEGEPTGRLVLLDGAHRLAAYRTTEPRFHNQGVPAIVMDGDWTTARLKAAGGNTKETLPLTANERADLAWSMVRDPMFTGSKVQIAGATGVSAPTVARMRSRWKRMQETAQEASGHWWRDRHDSNTGQETAPMIDHAKREADIETAKALVQQALGRWLRTDVEAIAETLERALGSRFKDAAEFQFGAGEDEFFEMPVGVTSGADDGEPERDF
jgi:hypothetical protein